MARKAQKTKKTPAAKTPAAPRRARPLRRILRPALRWLGRLLLGAAVLVVLLLGVFRFVNPPVTPYMLSEIHRLGSVQHFWVPLDRIDPVMRRSVVAAEDANFCRHWGFDMGAIRQAIDEGGSRGASTIDQQTVKNVFLWQGRNWVRKALEASIVPLAEVIWPKRRILEIYLNVVEFGDGVFGIGAAAEAAFHTTPDKLTPTQAALLAVVLPNPKERSAARPLPWLRRRAASVADGAATIAADGRDSCFSG